MEDCRLPTGAGIINCRAGIDVGPTVQEQSESCEVAVFRGHMQESSSLKCEAAPAAHAGIELRETPIHECGISVNQLRQVVQPPAEQFQHSRHVVLGRATGLEKDVDAGAQSFYGTRVTRNEVVESRAGIWMAAYLVPMVATVRICAVIEKPFKSGRIHRLAWRKDDREMSVPP